LSSVGDLPRLRSGRSFWLKFLAAGLLVLSVSGWLRMQQSIIDWQYLVEINLQPGPLYLMLTGGMIGLLSIVAAMSVWLRKRWGFVFARIIIIIWQAWNWADRLWIARSDTALTGWPFALGATIVIMVFVFAVLDEEERRLNEFERSRNRS
jgi:hypothetical protein